MAGNDINAIAAMEARLVAKIDSLSDALVQRLDRARREMNEASSAAAMDIIEARLAKLRGNVKPMPADGALDNSLDTARGRNSMMKIVHGMQGQIDRLQKDAHTSTERDALLFILRYIAQAAGGPPVDGSLAKVKMLIEILEQDEKSRRR